MFINDAQIAQLIGLFGNEHSGRVAITAVRTEIMPLSSANYQPVLRGGSKSRAAKEQRLHARRARSDTSLASDSQQNAKAASAGHRRTMVHAEVCKHLTWSISDRASHQEPFNHMVEAFFRRSKTIPAIYRSLADRYERKSQRA